MPRPEFKTSTKGIRPPTFSSVMREKPGTLLFSLFLHKPNYKPSTKTIFQKIYVTEIERRLLYAVIKENAIILIQLYTYVQKCRLVRFNAVYEEASQWSNFYMYCHIIDVVMKY